MIARARNLHIGISFSDLDLDFTLFAVPDKTASRTEDSLTYTINQRILLGWRVTLIDELLFEEILQKQHYQCGACHSRVVFDE